jgi:Flp pilus assembly protein TadG
MMGRMESEAGTATVELALLVPLLMVLLVGVTEIAVAAGTQLEVLNAAREGARVAAVNPEPADAVATTRTALGEMADRARIGVSRPHVVGEPAVVTVVLRHRIVPILFGGTSVELRAKATMRVEK